MDTIKNHPDSPPPLGNLVLHGSAPPSFLPQPRMTNGLGGEMAGRVADRDVRLFRLCEGTSEIRNIITRSMLRDLHS